MYLGHFELEAKKTKQERKKSSPREVGAAAGLRKPRRAGEPLFLFAFQDRIQLTFAQEVIMQIFVKSEFVVEIL